MECGRSGYFLVEVHPKREMGEGLREDALHWLVESAVKHQMSEFGRKIKERFVEVIAEFEVC